MKKLRVGVIGGGVGRIHIEAYQALPADVELVALCDANETRLQEVADRYRVPHRFTDYRELVAAGLVEAVSIALPNSLHTPVSVAALEAGLHVLCEKPLAESAAAGQKIVEAAAKSTAKFMICFNRRYRPDVRWIRQAIDTGLLGQVYQVHAGWLRETGIPGGTGWFANKQIAGGGPLIDLGVHMLDLVLWLLGYPQPRTVSGDVQANFGPRELKTWHSYGAGTRGSFEVEDSASAFIRLAGGASLFLETSWASHAKPGLDDFFVTVRGTHGTVELYVPNYAWENTLTFYTEINGGPVTVRPHVVGQPADHFEAVADFVACIKTDSPPTATAADGLTVMQIIEAIYQSAANQREVVF